MSGWGCKVSLRLDELVATALLIVAIEIYELEFLQLYTFKACVDVSLCFFMLHLCPGVLLLLQIVTPH